MLVILQKIADRFNISWQLLSFFWDRKVWWLIPVIILLLFLAIVLIFAQGAAIIPFAYTLI